MKNAAMTVPRTRPFDPFKWGLIRSRGAREDQNDLFVMLVADARGQLDGRSRYFVISLILSPTFWPTRSTAFPAFSKGRRSQAARTRRTAAEARIRHDLWGSFIASHLSPWDGPSDHQGRTRLPVTSPMTTEMKKTIRNTKKSTLAISAAPVAMPPNPKIAATIAMMKNPAAQRSMLTSI